MGKLDIIDIVDFNNIATQLFVIPSAIERIHFVRVTDDAMGSVYVLARLKRKNKHETEKNEKAVLFESGRVNFDGGAGSIQNLKSFRLWLDENGLLERVDPALWHTTLEMYQQTFDIEQFDPRGLVVIRDGGIEEEAQRRFEAWLGGDEQLWRDA